ncbi:MAG: MATE family efflux transporter [Muribaculaceae bacterium]|nr:MATE family efflux transporter [Muribaculaceae bacterium]
MKNKEKSPAQLGETPILRLLMEYSIPAIIASTAVSLYNIVDSIFIGRGVSPLAISGLAVTFPLMNLLVACCTLIAAGGATMSSIFLGQKEIKRANETLNTVFVLCLIHGVIFAVISMVFLRPILTFFGATESIMPYAYDFMKIIVYGTPITYLYFGLNNLMRATGYPKKAMLSALFSVVANIILAPIFIFALDWGIKGAAIATVISQGIALIWVLSHFLNKNSYIRFRKGYKAIQIKLLPKLYGIGLSPFLMNVCSCVVVIIINRELLNYGGDIGDLNVGSYGIINRISMLSVMIVFGITQGMQPVLGYNYGASNWARVKQTLKYGLIAGSIITTFGWVMCQCIPGKISMLFTTDSQLIDITSRGLRLSLIFWPLVGLQLVIQNFFQSIGMPKISIFLSLTRQMIFLVPLLLLFSHMWGTDGVWLSLSTSDCIASILAIGTLIYQTKKIGKFFANNKAHVVSK